MKDETRRHWAVRDILCSSILDLAGCSAFSLVHVALGSAWLSILNTQQGKDEDARPAEVTRFRISPQKRVAAAKAVGILSGCRATG
jgi:hypothetical protein